MSAVGLAGEVTSLLTEMNRRGGYRMSLVCTDQGLLVASAGEGPSGEELAGLTGLFDTVVQRARRDLEMGRVDEVTLLDAGRGRIVVRPLALDGEDRFFLVVHAPPRASWRRSTADVCRRLVGLLEPLARGAWA